jgi:hypothetical protein
MAANALKANTNIERYVYVFKNSVIQLYVQRADWGLETAILLSQYNMLTFRNRASYI